PVSIITAIFATVLTLILVSGLNKKTITSIVGTIGGVVFAGIIAILFSKVAKLTGLSSEEAQMLMFAPLKVEFNFQGLLFAGIILGALGAVMDVSMSIASSINELRTVNPGLKAKELFSGGMNVGKDIMGTMTNTLILAYAGASIQLMLLFMAYNVPIDKIINSDMIATEVVRALTGTLGLLVAIPLTAFIGSILMEKKSKL
ncbi:MAG: YibE/F family protein, partial [Eubacteriales bacterium]